MFHAYSDEDVLSAHAALDALQEDSALPPLEFARALVQKTEEIARKAAAEHQAAGRRLNEPDFVALCDTLAGIVDHTDPEIRYRG